MADFPPRVQQGAIIATNDPHPGMVPIAGLQMFAWGYPTPARHFHDASDLTSGVLGSDHGGAGAVAGILVADGHGNVRQAVPGVDFLPIDGDGSRLSGLNAQQMGAAPLGHTHPDLTLHLVGLARGTVSVPTTGVFVDVAFASAYASEPYVVITPQERPDNEGVLYWWVSGITTTGFRINVDTAPNTDGMPFHWIAVG